MRVLLSGGGTGGHIYPALAMLKEIRERVPQASFLYIGTNKGLEADIVPKEGIPFESIEITGFKRKLSVDNLKTILRFLQGVRESKRIIRRFKPDIVIGTGGYVCGPVVFAAARLHIPTLIHEQNVVPGLTNKFLSRYATKVAVSFSDSKAYFKRKGVHITGNPRASEVLKGNGHLGRKTLSLPQDKKVVLIVGGSRGAKAINQAFLDMLDRLGELADCHFVYVTGSVHYEEISQTLSQVKDLKQVTIKPFIYNMPDVLAATDLIINRAGASFLAEITALGLPAILIPSPYVTNNHQEKNARWLESHGAARVILEGELSGERLFHEIKDLVTQPKLLEKMKQKSKSLGVPDAGERIYQLIEQLVTNK